MAYTVRYANFDLTTGNNDGTTEADAWQTLADLNTGMTGGGFLCHIKKQAARQLYTGNPVIMCPNALIGNPSIIRGYGTTINDGVRWEFGTTSSANLLMGEYTTWDYVDIDESSGGRTSGDEVGTCIKRSIVRANGDVRFATFDSCYIELRNFGFIRGQGTGVTRMYRTYVRRTGNNAVVLAGMDMFGHPLTVMDCIFHGNGVVGQHGLQVGRHNDSRGCVVANNIFYNCDDGITFPNIESNFVGRFGHIYGNLFDTMAGYAIAAPTTVVGQNRLMNNYYRNCTSGFTNYGPLSADDPPVVLSADPFVDAANNDFTINDTVGGGRVLRDAGFSANLASGAMLNRPFGSFLSQLGGGGGTPPQRSYWG